MARASLLLLALKLLLLQPPFPINPQGIPFPVTLHRLVVWRRVTNSDITPLVNAERVNQQVVDALFTVLCVFFSFCLKTVSNQSADLSLDPGLLDSPVATHERSYLMMLMCTAPCWLGISCFL